jgi:nucleotide-binding universal stress UspA family protein
VYRSILVASDGSSTAQKAVDRAVELASASGASVTILTVGPPPTSGEVVAAEAARVVAPTAGAIEVRTKVDNGDPAELIVDEAERGGYDLLVVGNKGMTGATRFFLGSVPNKVSHHAPCALLIVRTT